MYSLTAAQQNRNTAAQSFQPQHCSTPFFSTLALTLTCPLGGSQHCSTFIYRSTFLTAALQHSLFDCSTAALLFTAAPSWL
jgi:hypothetical protein